MSTEEVPDRTQLDVFFTETFLAFLMFNRGFYPVWDAWLKKFHADFSIMNAIFNGHAKPIAGQWLMCADAPYDKPVQEFVDEQDGHALLILLLCCNSNNKAAVTSKKSLVIYNRSAMSLFNMQSRRSRQIMHIPGHGDFVGTTDEKALNAIALEHGYEPAFIS